VRLEQSLLGSFEFEALYPATERVFTEEDFSFDDCDQINSIILEEAKTFVTFMQTMVEDMLGKEDYMLNFLYGKADLYKSTMYQSSMKMDDDDEDEEWDLLNDLAIYNK